MRQANADEVGDSQMMAISDEGVGVGVIQKLTIADRGGKRGLCHRLYEPHILADKICEQPPIKYIQSILAYILPVHTCYWEKGY